MRVENQLEPLGEDRDRRDAAAIHEIYKGLGLVRSTSDSKGYPNQAAREAIVKIWQEPRMPKPRHTHNKPLEYPWSQDARDLYFAGKTSHKLVLEHVRPISHLRDELFEAVSKPGCTDQEIHDLLVKAHKNLCFAIITKAEDDRMTAAGLRTALADAEGDWARYEQALQLTEDHFGSVINDDRYVPKVKKTKKAAA